MWVTPEVERRQAAGIIPRPVELTAAQIIFYPDRRPTEVRINSEVRGFIKLHTKPGVEKQKGDPIYAHEVEGHSAFELADDDDPDCGHITIVRFGDSWAVSFDFIYNKGLSSRHIDTADQFLEAADHAFNNQMWSPFVDCLFSAAELLAKSILLGTPDPGFREKATHKSIHNRFNRWGHLGNIEQPHVHVFNQLSQLRASARYVSGCLSIDDKQAGEWLEAIRELREKARQRIPR